jgi:two-component system copper resistance phosphate regulon response regulator CusR
MAECHTAVLPMQILIVEDEALIADFLARAFRTEGFQTHVAADGESAIALLDEGWDLIVLDLLLPGCDGFAVLRTVSERCPGTPVFVLSARSRVETKVAAFDAGASDYLAKPFSLDELLARVRARISVRRQADPPAEADCVRIDDSKRRVIFDDGSAVALSVRELAVLRYLLRSPDEIVSRERLLNAVWEYGFDPRSNVVDVCIGRLRRKLDPLVTIETVRGAGYRLNVSNQAG